MTRTLYVLLFFFAGMVVQAQTTNGLRAHFTFSDCVLDDNSGFQTDGSFGGGPVVCDCGVAGDGLYFSGGRTDFAFFTGDYGAILNADFSLSFYFRSENTGGIADLISVTDSCGGTGMYVSYIPVNQSVIFEIETEGGARRDLVGEIDLRSCWQHVVITRASNRYTMYINGEVEAVEEVRLAFDMSPLEELRIANSPCLNLPGQLERFRGVIDDLRLYSRAVSSNEVAELYFSPDKLFTSDTLIFTGDEVPVRAGFSCAANISWNPSIGVSDPGILTPILRPVTTTSYQVVVSYGACVLRDTLKVLVTERDSLDCDNLLLPTAFSPNGDGLNDVFEISNPFLIDQLDNWTVFDRNGGIMFEGTDPLDGWDGTFHDKALAPDYFGYRIEYQCKGETFQKVGSFYLMR